jgi:hypothetical protein
VIVDASALLAIILGEPLAEKSPIIAGFVS